jgi:hypothetical protein
MAANGLSTRRQQSNGKRGIPPAKRKIAARQSSIAPANRNIAAQQSEIAPAWRKSAARQSTDHAGQKKNSHRGNQGSRRPLQKLRRGIAPASWKFAVALQQSVKAEMAWGNSESKSNMERQKDRAGQKKNCDPAIEDRAGQNKNRGAAIEYRAGQWKHRGTAIGDHAGLKKIAAWQSRIAPAKIKIAARQSTDRAGQKKNCSAAIRDCAGQNEWHTETYRRRRPHNNQLRRGWPEETANPNRTWSTT